MKKIYDKPAVRVFCIGSQSFVLVGSDVIPPSPPNQPAGGRRFGASGFDDWDDDEEEE